MVGTDVATALNTAETNLGLNEVVKNQQAQLLLEKENQVRDREADLREHQAWESFIGDERKRRRSP